MGWRVGKVCGHALPLLHYYYGILLLLLYGLQGVIGLAGLVCVWCGVVWCGTAW